MTVSIGPNFGNEIAAAGLLGLPFSWGPDGVNVADPRLTSTQITAINAVVAAHDHTKPDASLAVQINSTGTPVIDAVYPIDAATCDNIVAIAECITVTSKFPGGVTSIDYADVSGTFHTFSSTTLFQNFAAVIAGYVAGWKLYRAGHIPTQPAGPLTIA